MRMGKTNIVIAGVGGQGTLLATQILGEAALKAGLHVMASEIHGMAQRGGVVVSTVRIGDISSPLVADGDADVLLGFEPVETLRESRKSSPDKTTIITNISPVQPFTVSLGMAKYPPMAEVISALQKAGKRLVQVDMDRLVMENGIPAITSNIILLGVLAGTGTIPVPKEHILAAVLDNVPKKSVTENQKAFEAGFSFGKSQVG